MGPTLILPLTGTGFDCPKSGIRREWTAPTPGWYKPAAALRTGYTAV